MVSLEDGPFGGWSLWTLDGRSREGNATELQINSSHFLPDFGGGVGVIEKM
jgi:hypothetical protein